RVTEGPIGARLHAGAWASPSSHTKRYHAASPFTWRLAAGEIPAVATVPIGHRDIDQAGLFGIFESERKARNALVRLAIRHGLCQGLLGIDGRLAHRCTACAADRRDCVAVLPIARKKQLLRLFGALSPHRVADWPYAGAMGIRERRDLHVI